MKALVCLVISLIGLSAFAQESSVNATNPASLKWFQINTPHFRLLYPQGFDSQAQRMANTLESIREPEARTIGSVPRKISVVLQSQSSVSNGFVSVTPRRVEFYTMPSQNYNFLGNNDWLNLLASHEYRHVAQFQHAKRGFNKVFYYLGGANFYAALSYVSAPQWFWEGDAVATETAFTQSGRGRIPNFDLILRTNLQEGRVFNYHKQYLRSYKNNINDHYVLGYNMVSYLRKKTNDPMIWDKVTARAWNVPFIPFRFSSALKRETGLYVKDLYKEMASDLQKEWKTQQDTIQITSFEKVNPRTTKAYTDYLYPQELESGNIVARKSGIGDIEQLVLLKEGSERKIFTQGLINESAMLSSAGSRVVWNEFRFDPRWQVRTYSAIVAYDLNTGKRQVIARKGRYASAAISPDGKKVATVETTTEYQTRLVVLDYSSGAVLKTFDNPDNNFLAMPRWTTDGKEIVALLTNAKGKSIMKYDFESGELTPLTEPTNENIGHPVPVGPYVLYNSPVSGIDNIYALDVKSGNRYQITSAKYGSYNPMVTKDGKWICYNNQGRDGMDVVKIPFDPSSWKLWTNFNQPQNGFGHLVKQEGQSSLFKNLPRQPYESKRYHRWKGIINPFSWGPTIGTAFTNPQIPIGITSQDLLSTTQIFAGWIYDRTEANWIKKATVSYQGWYPIIDFSISESDRKVDEGAIDIDKHYSLPSGGDSAIHATRNLTFKWHERNTEVGLRIPLNTTTSKYFGNISLGNAVGVTQTSKFSNSVNNSRIVPTLFKNDTIYRDENHPIYFLSDQTGNGNLIYNHFSLSGYRLLKQSRRDINSKLGQAFFMDIYNTPYGGNYSGAQFSCYGLLFFPGLAKHHSFWGYAGYQYSQIAQLPFKYTYFVDNGNYIFRNQLPLPRGALGISRDQNMYSVLTNYTMPVWYPDIAIGPLLNIQRLRVNGFFDYGLGKTVLSQIYTQSYMSTGVEVKLDLNVMRFLPQLDIGIRYSKGLNPSTSLVELLIGAINF